MKGWDRQLKHMSPEFRDGWPGQIKRIRRMWRVRNNTHPKDFVHPCMHLTLGHFTQKLLGSTNWSGHIYISLDLHYYPVCYEFHFMGNRSQTEDA